MVACRFPPEITVSGQPCAVIGVPSPSDDAFTCVAPARALLTVSADVAMTVDGQQSNAVGVVYDEPRVTAVSPGVINAVEAGPLTLSVFGVNFGVPTARVGSHGSAGTTAHFLRG